MNDECVWGVSGIFIPVEVLSHPQLSQTEKLLFGYLKNIAQSSRGCWATNAYLSKLVGVGERTVRDAISTLHKHKFIRVEMATVDKGQTERRIYIDTDYQTTHRNIAQETNDRVAENCHPSPGRKLPPPLAENCHPSPGRKLPPPLAENCRQKEALQERSIEDCKTSLSQGKTPTLQRTKPPSPTPTKQNATERSKQYVPIADQLANIVKKYRRVHIPQQHITNWSYDIRKLCEEYKMNPARVKRALDWYADNIGGECVPVIMSGSSLYEKFEKLENAIERSKQQRTQRNKPTQEQSKLLDLTPEKRRMYESVGINLEVCGHDRRFEGQVFHR